MSDITTDKYLNAFAPEMRRLRTDLNAWFWTQDNEEISDEAWAESALGELKDRGFVFIEKVTPHEVLICLGRNGIVHVSRAPYRPLAIARSIRMFAESSSDANLLTSATSAF